MDFSTKSLLLLPYPPPTDIHEKGLHFEEFMKAVERELDNEIGQIKTDSKNEFYGVLEYNNPFAAIFVKNCRKWA